MRFDTAKPDAAPPAATDQAPLVLSVGRLIEKKGYPDLIDACARLDARGLTFRCEVAGDGPLEESLRTQIAQLGLQDRVRLLGPTSQDDIIRKLAETRVFALACATERDGGRDNLPTVIMEAMAAGVPCVSTRLAGVPEMVDHGVTGLLVEEHDSDALADAIATLLRDPVSAGRMGQAGRERARHLFAQESTAAQLLNHFATRGLMRFDPSLVVGHPALAAAYARQGLWRMTRLVRGRGLRHRRPPDFLMHDRPASGV
jgi:glycosyltransferase involved in cell wall biosynthesis